MEAMTQKRGYPLQQVAPARIPSSQPAHGSRTRSIAQKKRRAKYRRRRIIALLILIAVLIALVWGVASLVRIIWNAAAAEIPDVSTSTPIVVERPIISTTSAPAATVTPAARYTLTAEERDTVERVVMAEAGGESFEGKMLVAQCILTATEKTGLQPSEVVVKYKYTASRPEPSQSVKDAVAAVFDRGELVVDEPVMYFYNPAIVESEWHESQIFVIEVGGHRFFAERSQNNER